MSLNAADKLCCFILHTLALLREYECGSEPFLGMGC